MKKWLGITGMDFVIQAVVTGCMIGALIGHVVPDEVVVFGLIGLSVIVLAVRRHFALKRQGDVESTGELAAQHVAELEMRLNDLELGQARVAELEDRLDFAERLLAQRQDQMLPGPSA